MTPPPNFINPPRPPVPYRIPAAKETTRLAAQWKALSGIAKVGIVTGGVLSLGVVGAFANPLTSKPTPQVPQLVNISATASALNGSAPAPSKVATTAAPTTASPATTPAVTTAPATVETTAPVTTAAAVTKAPTTAKTTTATKTTTAAKTTIAAVSGAVTAGAFCSPAGKTGVTSTGKPMVCKTSATDTRLRWRAA